MEKRSARDVLEIMGTIGAILVFGLYIASDVWIVMNARYQSCPDGQALTVDLFWVPGVTPPYSCGP